MDSGYHIVDMVEAPSYSIHDGLRGGKPMRGGITGK